MGLKDRDMWRQKKRPMVLASSLLEHQRVGGVSVAELSVERILHQKEVSLKAVAGEP